MESSILTDRLTTVLRPLDCLHSSARFDVHTGVPHYTHTHTGIQMHTDASTLRTTKTEVEEIQVFMCETLAS